MRRKRKNRDYEKEGKGRSVTKGNPHAVHRDIEAPHPADLQHKGGEKDSETSGPVPRLRKCASIGKWRLLKELLRCGGGRKTLKGGKESSTMSRNYMGVSASPERTKEEMS